MNTNADAAMSLLEGNQDVATHGREVARIATRVAYALGLGEQARAAVGVAAALHDIGKVPISAEILNKPGPLSLEEWTQVRLHPVLGAQLLMAEGLGEFAPWVRSHHERPDGSGYPDGLEGDAIPLQSRIIAVADAYDAMVSERPYATALSEVAARQELLRGSGTQFDRRVVAAFLGARVADPRLRPTWAQDSLYAAA